MIKATQLRKTYGKKSEVVALDSMSFAANDGEITGLLGPNGAGKTSAMRASYGLLALDSGEIQIDDVIVADNPEEARRRIGIFPDNFGLYSRLTTREHLEYYGELHGMTRVQMNEAIERVSAMLGMDDILERRTEGFSQGQRMKVGLGRAILHSPRNLILDEPTRGLDVMSTRAFREVLLGLKAAGHCIIFSSHVMQEVAALCDRIIVVAKGKVVDEGTPDELCERTGESLLEEAFVKLVGTEGIAA